MQIDFEPCAVNGSDPCIMQNIKRDNCNIVIWERRGVPDYAPLMAGAPADIRFECEACDFTATLGEALRHCGYLAPHLHSAFITDVALLAQHFCEALALVRFEFRLEVVTTDSCRKFHADYVNARLITTYVGPGTEWLDAKAANQLAQGDAPHRINRMMPGDVGIFKGKMATLRPAIHRSPPISQTGEQRLLLVLNPAEGRRD